MIDDQVMEFLDEWAGYITSWNERAEFWEDVSEFATQNAKDLREDHEDTLGQTLVGEWES